MKTASAKAKGRRLAQEIRSLIGYYLCINEENIYITPSGVNGPDLTLSLESRSKFPYRIECKNQERVNIWDAWAQARSHVIAEGGDLPLLIIKRNKSKPLVVMDGEEFIKLHREKIK